MDCADADMRAFLGFSVCIWKWSVAEDLADDFPSSAFFVDASCDVFHSLFCFDESGAVGVGIWGSVDDGTEEEGVLEEALDGFDEERGQIPSVSEGRGKGTCVSEIGR